MSSLFDSLTKNPELLLTVGGAAAGAYYGGPQGASTGLLLGSLAGQTVRSAKSKQGLQAEDVLRVAGTGLALKSGAAPLDAISTGAQYGSLLPKQQYEEAPQMPKKIKKKKKKKKTKPPVKKKKRSS